MAKKRKEVRRRPVGICVTVSKSGPHAYQLYDVQYDDMTSEIVRGDAVFCWPGMRPVNPTKKEKAQELARAKFYRPDLSDHMKAAAILLEPISNACWDADVPKKEKKRGK